MLLMYQLYFSHWFPVCVFPVSETYETPLNDIIDNEEDTINCCNNRAEDKGRQVYAG
uniref:Uncharacterized protein n=1 Tax=Arion vulgaris TaxID=1028688 RepID=A0A0B6XUS8_9EUPU